MKLNTLQHGALSATLTALVIQGVCVGLLAPFLPRELCRPGVHSTRILKFPAAKSLEIDNADGEVYVTTVPGDTIEVRAEVQVYGDSEKTGELDAFQKTLIQATEADSVLRLNTESVDRPDSVELLVDYTVTVPPRTNLRIRGNSGNVRIGENCGDVAIEGNNRDIHISRPQGSVQAKSMNGRIQVYDAQGRTDLETVNGKIYVHMQGGALSAKTTNGNIVASLLDDDIGSCDLNSLNGGITLVLSERSSANVNAATARGVIRCDVAVDHSQGKFRRRVLNGRIGAGQTQLVMNSMNGNIWIARSN